MDRKKPAIRQAAASLIERLGIVGMESIEPVVLAALIQEEPLLLIGPHGTGKSYLLNRLAAALGLEQRHYNASLLNFDDLVGYPLPHADGSLRYVQTPASIWGAQAVFFDEISRCRPDMQNKLFPIIHERRVQGLALTRLSYRWSAMNPPASEDGDTDYTGSEPLDPALADRFAFIVEMPDWQRFEAGAQETLILKADGEPDPAAAEQLRRAVTAGRHLADGIRTNMAARLAIYVRIACSLLRQGGLVLSPRRANMLLRNIVGVHAARLQGDPAAATDESALAALTHSLPQRATGERVEVLKLLAAHKEAWRAAAVEDGSPLRYLLVEPDPLRRALAALRLKLPKADFSTVMSECLTTLPPGARHALAYELLESGAAGRLVAAVADQCADWYGIAALPHDIAESVASGGIRHRVWQKVVAELAKLKAGDPETPLVSNLVTNLFARGELAAEADVDRVLQSWAGARAAITGRVR